ncbi:MAG: RecQ family ATP-dependent DNA helicase [Candidatus Riflebacteria bacterium]|nr:RecQ family ATP-dependent DNA helicase [Candidatus Riflebacteria bacterium]
MKSLQKLLEKCVAIDIEINPADGRFISIGAIKPGEPGLIFQTPHENPGEILAKIEEYSKDREFLLGHNLIDHDLEWIYRLFPSSKLLQKNAIDTLVLAPLSFPKHPYHRLWKGYKPVKESKNNPLKDSEVAIDFFKEEFQALVGCDLLPIYQFLFLQSLSMCISSNSLTKISFSGCYTALQMIKEPEITDWENFSTQVRNKFSTLTCKTNLEKLLEDRGKIFDPVSVAMAFSWISVSGGNSRPSPWVIHRFLQTTEIISMLRDKPCFKCQYCHDNHDSTMFLKSEFNLPNFRNVTGRPPFSQKDVIDSILAGNDVLVIMPTGGGKSLCYQLPGLMKARARKTLTLVISPLQSLMKDQVDSLKRRCKENVGALNGLLTFFERIEVLEGLAMGEIDLLFAAPEQLRNENFCNVLRNREIGLVVIDEAHCLSKWGHDFRPDYLFICRFLIEVIGRESNLPPIACFTATAKKDVIYEIHQYFRKELGKDLLLFQGTIDRPNLNFFVEILEPSKKREKVLEIIKNLQENAAVVVFTATRNGAEGVAEFLKKNKINADFFHAGRPPEEKRRVQNEFLDGTIRAITATNAFGMGVDKPDIRAVIHFDVPGSLENYLQEAGRAGRDEENAECHLLFSPLDLETQFQLSCDGKINFSDLSGIFRGVKHLALSKKDGKIKDVVKTPGEILREEETKVDSFDYEDHNADTKLKIAVSWLEKINKLERNWNRVSVIQAKPTFASLPEALSKLETLGLSESVKTKWTKMIEILFRSDSNSLLNTDFLVGSMGTDSDSIVKMLRAMREAGLILNDLNCSAIVGKMPDHPLDSMHCWQRFARIESEFVRIISDMDNSSETNEIHLNARLVSTVLKDRAGFRDTNQDDVRRVLKGLRIDESLTFRSDGFEHFKIVLKEKILTVCNKAAFRQKLTSRILELLLSKIKRQGLYQLIEFSINEIEKEFNSFITNSEPPQKMSAFDWGKKILLFLNEIRAIQLQGGLAVFRPALTLRLKTTEPPRASECDELDEYFDQKIVQIHVMGQYATFGRDDIRLAMAMVKDYFRMENQDFCEKYFRGKKGKLAIPTGEDSYAQILGKNLSQDNSRFQLSEIQREVVTEKVNSNILVLAGPGSGKTKTIVHRAAFLVRVRRAPFGSVLIVAFNRSTVIEIRRRLKDLIGPDAKRIVVQTYHGLALRIAGRSLSQTGTSNNKKRSEPAFENIVEEAVDVLQKYKGQERDEITGGLIGHLRFVLVDEYQDINLPQYKMIALLARKDEPDAERKIHLLAVGDDDQNIYQWNGSNIAFLRKFGEDYNPARHNLLINYRSIPEIVEFSQKFIQNNPGRLKENVSMSSAIEADIKSDIGSSIRLVACQNDIQTDSSILTEIKRFREHGLKESEIVLLAYRNDDVLMLKKQAETDGTKCHVLRGINLNILKTREFRNFIQEVKKIPEETDFSLNEMKDIVFKYLDRENSSGNPWTEALNFIAEEFFESASIASPKELLVFIFDCAREMRQGEVGKPDHLTLGTLHSAKGLEFSGVIVKLDGLGESLENSSVLIEHRRLLYVAMTRAKKRLSIVSSSTKTPLAIELGKLHDWKNAEEINLEGKGRFGEKLVAVLGTKMGEVSCHESAEQIDTEALTLPGGEKKKKTYMESPERKRENSETANLQDERKFDNKERTITIDAEQKKVESEERSEVQKLIKDGALCKAQIKIWELNPDHVVLSYPALSLPAEKIKNAIAGMSYGDECFLRKQGDSWYFWKGNISVGKMSRKGNEKMSRFSGLNIEKVWCRAILGRSKEDESQELRANLKLEEWEYPIFVVEFSSFKNQKPI